MWTVISLCFLINGTKAAWTYQTPWYDRAREYSDLKNFPSDTNNIWPRRESQIKGEIFEAGAIELSWETDDYDTDAAKILKEAVLRFNYFSLIMYNWPRTSI